MGERGLYAPLRAEPISLYIALEEGQKADLEVVARAAEAFVEAIRELAFVLDPALEIRVELLSGTESSLSLNSLIRIIKGDSVAELSVKAVIFAVIWWFTQHTLEWSFDKVMDEITGQSSPTVHISEDDKNDIATKVVKAIEGRVAQPQIQRVYRELERDPAVSGVGATQNPDRKPPTIVPRDKFAISGGYTEVLETPTRRRRVTIERLLIVSPVLKKGKRKWKFAFREGEFGAPIKDEASMQMLLSGVLPMREGIEIDAELETVEEKRGTVWVPVERNILRILRPVPRMVQADLDVFAPQQVRDSGEQKTATEG